MDSSGHKIDVTFQHPFQQDEVFAYELQMLVDPASIIQKLGNLKIIEWPKEHLSRITFLPGAGKIFFSSALAKIQVNPKNRTRSIVPADFMKSITSHSRKSSGIRIEWGIPSAYNVELRYQIQNSGDSPAKDLHLSAYVPPSTKFQSVSVDTNCDHELAEDEDQNSILNLKIGEIGPHETKEILVAVQIKKKGNVGAGVILPHFGTWEEFRSITQPNSIGRAMLKPSKYWPLNDGHIAELVGLLKKHAVNASQYIKLAFEFTNQKIQYEINGFRDNAANVLQSRKGDCSEMSDLLVSLLRGGGIPAKIVHGWVIHNENWKLEPHAWCEFFSNLGWRQCDPTWGYLTGVSCQHITRQREGLVPDQHAYSWTFQGDTAILIDENLSFHLEK